MRASVCHLAVSPTMVYRSAVFRSLEARSKGIRLTDRYLELLVKWTSQGDAAVARKWLEKHGFRVTEMTATPGAIVLGTDKQVEEALTVSLKDVKLPSNLTVPHELRDQVESISILKPPSYQF